MGWIAIHALGRDRRQMLGSREMDRSQGPNPLCLLAALLEVGGEPLETLVQTVTRGCTCGLDVPLALAEGVQAKLVGDVGCVHGVGKILDVS